MIEVKSDTSIDDVIEQILSARGLEDPMAREAFLNPSYEDGLHDPFLLAGMEPAVKRILSAIESEESIFIYGDYDIDGLSATALLKDALESFGAQVSAYIPDRFTEGYGINESALKKIKNQGGELVITVDCGSTALSEITWAQANDLDVIVTDHHEVPEELPPAVAVINPKRDGQKYPFRDLAGVGVAFKLVQALQQKTDGLPEGQEKWLLDLVALGTVCDIVGLIDENRVLVKYGLLVLEKTRRPGIKALVDITKMTPPFSASDLGFRIGPRLNASGRMEHAQKSLDVLIAKKPSRAQALATELNEINSTRKTEQSKIYKAALQRAHDQKENRVLVLADEDWSRGINGIVASKVLERHSKPTFIMQKLGEESKGSARSFGDFSVIEALRFCDDLLTTYGGHEYAGGFALATEDIPAFTSQLNDYYDSLELKDQADYLGIDRDVFLSSLDIVSEELIKALKRLAPFGQGNPQPVFAAEAVITRHKAVGSEGKHLQLTVRGEEGKTIRCIGFGHGERTIDTSQPHELRFYPQINEYKGYRNLQLQVLDFQPIKSST